MRVNTRQFLAAAGFAALAGLASGLTLPADAVAQGSVGGGAGTSGGVSGGSGNSVGGAGAAIGGRSSTDSASPM